MYGFGFSFFFFVRVVWGLGVLRVQDSKAPTGLRIVARFPSSASSTLLPFFWIPISKPNRGKKGTLVIQGSTGEPR